MTLECTNGDDIAFDGGQFLNEQAENLLEMLKN
jgi:hypothetical protein